MQEANRLKRLPLYLFTIMDQLKAQAREKGMDLIDLGMGNPDLPPPKHVIDALCKAAKDPKNHGYSKADGPVESKLRRSIADWYKGRFNVSLDPDKEVLPLIGAKEGIAHLCLAFLNNDDIALVPVPAYPVHFNGVIIAGGILYSLPINEENQFKPEYEKLDRHLVSRSKLFFVSYPHNPTAATVDLDFYERLVRWGRGKNMIIASDLAYSDLVYDNYKAPSIMQVKGAKDFCIEFHTMSKSYNMAGWRVGFAVGNASILQTLAKTKGYIDFGMFRAVQAGAIAALNGPQDCVEKTVAVYKERRDVFVREMRAAGWNVPNPKATFYIWAKIPMKFGALTSMEFAQLMLKETGIVCAPGTGFGEYGEGYVRFALVADIKRLKEAAKRIKKILEIEA